MVNLCLAELEIHAAHDWIEIALRSYLEVCVEFQIKVFDLKLHLGVLREDEGVYMLLCGYFPTLDCWKVDFEHVHIEDVFKEDLGVCYVEGWLVVLDVRPLEVVFQKAKQ